MTLLKIVNDISSNEEKINFFLSHTNQFVENGYESFTQRIPFNRWWMTNHYKNTFKIFFKKNFSRRPYLFIAMNKLQHFDFTQTMFEILSNKISKGNNKSVISTNNLEIYL